MIIPFLLIASTHKTIRLTLTLFMLRMLPQSSMYCFRSFSRYSKTSVNDFSVCTISCNVTKHIHTIQKLKFNLGHLKKEKKRKKATRASRTSIFMEDSIRTRMGNYTLDRWWKLVRNRILDSNHTDTDTKRRRGLKCMLQHLGRGWKRLSSFNPAPLYGLWRVN